MSGLTYGGTLGGQYSGQRGGRYGPLQFGKRIDLHESGANGPTDSTTALLSVEINLEHTALSDMTVELPPFEGLSADRYTGGEMHYSVDGRLLFAAEIDDVSLGEDFTVTLSGTSVEGQPLERNDYSVTFEETLTADAIELFIDAVLPYESVVYDTPPRPLSNKLVQRMSSSGDWFDTLTAAENHENNDELAREIPDSFDQYLHDGYIPTLHDTSPIQVTEEGVTLSQTNVFVEAENTDHNAEVRSGPRVSGGEHLNLKEKGMQLVAEFAFVHDIPKNMFDIAVRATVGPAGTEPFDRLEFSIDGQTVVAEHTADIIPYGDDYRWVFLDISYDTVLEGADVAAGDNPHELRIEKIEGDDWVYIDCITFHDSRFPFGGSLNEEVDSNGSLSAPHLYPNYLPVIFDRPAIGADITHAEWSVNYDAPATPGVPAIITPKTGHVEAGGDVYDSENTTVIERRDIPDEETVITIYGAAFIGSYDDAGRSKTPRENTEVQTVESAEMMIDGNELSVIVDPREFSGDPLSILQELHDHANRRFVLETGVGDPAQAQLQSFVTGDDSLARDVSDRWITTSKTREVTDNGDTNAVHVEGARAPDGTYYRGVARDEAAIARLDEETPDGDNGVRPVYLEDRSLTSDNDCLSRARTELRDRSRLTIGGDLDIAPELPAPGFSYRVRAFDETALDDDEVGYGQNYGQYYGVGSFGTVSALETTTYSESSGSASTSLSFERPSGLFRAFEEIADGNLDERPHPARDDVPVVSSSQAYPSPPDDEPDDGSEPPPDDGDGSDNPAAPTAVINYSPTNPDTGTAVDFDAINSFDDDGSITSYEWDFGDGTTATGETVTHTYDTADEYTVILTVTDNDGNTDVDTDSISIGSGGTQPSIAYLSDDPLSDAAWELGGSAGPGTHGGDHVDRPADMPTKAEANWIVRTKSEFVNALENGGDGAIIYIDDDVYIGGLNEQPIPRNAKLVGGFCDPERTENNGRGPRLFNNSNAPWTLYHFKSGQPVELWGLSVEGPSQTYFDPRDKPGANSDYYSGGFLLYPDPGDGEVFVYGCEFRGWTAAGLFPGARNTASNCRVERSTFVNNCMETLGYGIEQYNGHLDANLCYFNFNRHSISGFGYDTESWIVRNSMHGPDAISHAFDMHGLRQNTDYTGNLAGKYCRMENVTIPFTEEKVRNPGSGQEGFRLRGVSEEITTVADNHFYHPNPPDPPGVSGDPFWQTYPDQPNQFVNLTYSGNNYGERLEQGAGAPLNSPIQSQ